MRRLFLAAAALAVIAPFAADAQQCDTRFQMVNQTNQPVREIYIDSSALPQYTVDRLGQNVLQPGQTFNVTPQQAGMYDVLVVMQNNARAELRQVDVCRISVINITNNGLQAQ